MERNKSDLENKRDIQINSLIQNILSLKSLKSNEAKKESSEIKLARRLHERSYPKLSEKIACYLITRYEIDNNKFPSEIEVIQMMTDFLGNIQKEPKYYKLKDNIDGSRIDQIIGTGNRGKICSFNLKRFNQTKKTGKQLAVKIQKYDIPYDIHVHICSSILLALYGFQPKYYNKYFMEIGHYNKKSKIREFHKLNNHSISKNSIQNNMKWFILYNFTNIRDQIVNFMERKYNKELVKIDITYLNSETRSEQIEYNLGYFEQYDSIFIRKKNIILKELEKLLSIKEDFILDLIIFRTKRGCFEIKNEKLLEGIECLSSCYKVIKINGIYFFYNFFKKRMLNYENNHLSFNPALSWMLYIFFQKEIINEKQYNNYIERFNQMSKKFDDISENIKIKIKNKEIYYKNDDNSNNKNAKKKVFEVLKQEKRYRTPEKNTFFDISKDLELQNPLVQKEPEIIVEKINSSKNSDIIFEKINSSKDNEDIDKKNENSMIIFRNNFVNETKNKIEAHENDNFIKNKKRKSRFFGWCCGKDSVDVK